MMAFEGLRSTMFEWDMQLFYVEFIVEGANVKSPRFYKPRWMPLSLFKQGTTSNGNVVFEKYDHQGIEWEQFYDPDLERLFLEKMKPKAVIRRIDP